MKLFVITNDFPPRVGGINYFVDQLMRRLPADWSATIASSTYSGAEEFDRSYPHEVVRFSTEMLLPTPAVRRQMHSLIRERKPDLVLFGALWPLGHMGPGIRQKLGVPYGGFTHGLELTAALVPGLMRGIGRNASMLTAPSAWSRGKLEGALGWKGRMAVLPSGIDAEGFHPGVSDALVRERHVLGDDPVICCVSRLVARKGQDTLIRAMPLITSAVPNARLLIVGSGPYDGELKALAARTHVQNRVIFAGKVSYEELPLYFRAGNVFAMPCRSRWFGLDIEALGAVFLQGAAVGRAVIAGNTGGAPEAVKDGVTGLVVDPESVTKVAEACVKLLNDRGLAESMGAAGATWVHRDYTWEAIAQQMALLATKAVS